VLQTDRQTDGRTDGRTDRIAVASTALAMRALHRAMKMGVVLINCIGVKVNERHCWWYLTISTNVRCYYHVVCEILSFSNTVHPVHLAFNTVLLLQHKTLNFLSPKLWPHNSPELNSTDYEIKTVIKQHMSMSCK